MSKIGIGYKAQKKAENILHDDGFDIVFSGSVASHLPEDIVAIKNKKKFFINVKSSKGKQFAVVITNLLNLEKQKGTPALMFINKTNAWLFTLKKSYQNIAGDKNV